MNPYDPNAEQPQLPKQALLQMLAGGGDPTQSGMQQAGNAGMFEPAIGAIANAAPGIAAAAAPPGPTSGSNVDRFMAMLSDPQYKSAQDAVNAFNGLGLSGDSTGLSSNYGSSPAVYDNGNTIGLPDRYMTRSGNGWTTTMRSQGGSGGGGSQMPSTLMLSGLNPILQGNATSNINNALQNIGAMTKGNSYLQSLIDALGGGGMRGMQ